MAYPQSLIVNLLQTFIKADLAKASKVYLQIIPYQKLNRDVLKDAIKNHAQGKICYLLKSEETVHHALIITLNDKKVICDYIYLNKAFLTEQEISSYFDFDDINFSFTTKTANKLNQYNLQGSNRSVAFTEALCQLLIQEAVSTIDIKQSILKHYKFCQAVVTSQVDKHELPKLEKLVVLLFKICQQVAVSQLSSFKNELPQLEQPMRLLCLYGALISLLKKQELLFQQYIQQKSRCYKTKNVNAADCVQFLENDNLYAIITINTAQDLLNYLNEKCHESLKNLLRAEKMKFSKASPLQKLIEISQIFYYTSPINIYGVLAVQVPNLTQRLITNNSVLTNKTVVKKITVAELLKIFGMMTGSYILINSGPYYIAKPLVTYYASQNLASHLHSEGFNDETAEVTEPFLNYKFDAADWYLLISNLLLLLEALCSKDTREPVYVGLAIAVNLFFTLIAKRYLPDTPAERMTLLMVISLFSHLLTNTVVGYAYEVSDNQAVCDAASKQFKDAIEGQTVAIETSCSSTWVPNFFNDKKLTVVATNNKGDAYEFECDIHDNGLQKISNCNVTQEYGKLLIK